MIKPSRCATAARAGRWPAQLLDARLLSTPNLTVQAPYLPRVLRPSPRLYLRISPPNPNARHQLQAHCEAPDAGQINSPSGGVGRGARKRVREAEERPLVNTHSTYTERDVINRTRLGPELRSELQRLAEAHMAMLPGLGIREL